LFSKDRENYAAPGLEGGAMDVTLIWERNFKDKKKTVEII
jgi:hypothetical protein